jgi:hypothetical protein
MPVDQYRGYTDVNDSGTKSVGITGFPRWLDSITSPDKDGKEEDII